MKKTHILETDLKTINGQSVLGSGNIVITTEEVDLTNYYDKTQTYNKGEVDTKIADIPPTDLTNYYNKTEVDNKIADIPETDLSNYYNKTETYSKVETDSLVDTKQDTLVSGTSIKTINGQNVLGNGDITISDATAVQLTGNQTIEGTKTFSSNPISTATQSTATNALTRKDYVDTKATVASPTFTGTVTLPATTSIGTVSSTELEYLDGVTSNIQTQLAGKLDTTATAAASTKLANARTINGVAFDGSANITVSDDTKLTKTNPSIIGSITEGVYNLTVAEINPTNGTIQYKTVSANTTFTETLISGQSVLLRLINANSYTITFPTITWVGKTAPVLTANCVIVLWKEQTTLYGAYVGSLV